MSYTYDQRKRPQGQTESLPAQTSPAGPVSAPLRADSAGTGDPFGLETAMRERMARTFGDLSAVKNYQPPAQAKTPVSAGPYAGPVGHAVSSSAPSAFSAGVMQAKKYKDTNSSGRAYLEDDVVHEGAANYNDLDASKWTEITRTPTGLAKLFKKTRRFKARIDRRAWEMTRDELAANPSNPNKVSDLTELQNNIGTAGRELSARPDPENGITGEQAKNGLMNRMAWNTFQENAGREQAFTKTASGGDWNMTEVDHEAFTTKLKNMSRMVRDYPELKGNIGSLYKIDEKERNDKKKEKNAEKKSLTTTDKSGQTKPKKLRQRLTRKKKEKPKAVDPAAALPLDQGPKKKKKEGESTGTTVMAAGGTTEGTFPLFINASLEGTGKDAADQRSFINKELDKRHGTSLDFAANHELGHMLNYLLIRERNKGKGNRKQEIKDDMHYHTTANELVEKALKATMPEEEFKKLVRYEEDSLAKDEAWDPNQKLAADEEWATSNTDMEQSFKKGMINLRASKLGASGKNKGYTTDYGATNASEFFAEAFADVYQNGEDAREASKKLVQLYEEEMKKAKAANQQ